MDLEVYVKNLLDDSNERIRKSDEERAAKMFAFSEGSSRTAAVTA